jgi:hypothetical protein
MLARDWAQVRLSERGHVVETFPSDRADQSLRILRIASPTFVRVEADAAEL